MQKTDDETSPEALLGYRRVVRRAWPPITPQERERRRERMSAAARAMREIAADLRVHAVDRQEQSDPDNTKYCGA